jgi:quercetin dioxygenase-like cupin family protein
VFIINENEREYRFGDSGPKYLMRGPRMHFALVQFQAGEDFKAHYHNVMEENFFVMDGRVDIEVDGAVYQLSQGDLIHIEPGEAHYVINRYDSPVKMVSTLAPYVDTDKVEIHGTTEKHIKGERV